MKEMIPLLMDMDGNMETVVFKIMHLTHQLMVGLPWLHCHNPIIEWHPSI
jgi:hypothetical protein